MEKNHLLHLCQQMGTGLAFIAFPLVFIFAFAVHPGLLNPHLLSPTELILRAHHDDLLQFGHVLVLLNTTLLVAAALHLMKVLDRHGMGWAGFTGAALAILGAIFLAADKGALCLTLSALDTLPENEFVRLMPGLLVLFAKQGWLALLWGILALPLGFAIQAVALFRTPVFSRWQVWLFLIGVLLVGTPDGLEIVNLSASVLMAAAFIPYGVRLMARAGGAAGGDL